MEMPSREIWEGEGDDTCPCRPCRARRWVTAWAEGKTDARPEDQDILWILRRMIEPEKRDV